MTFVVVFFIIPTILHIHLTKMLISIKPPVSQLLLDINLKTDRKNPIRSKGMHTCMAACAHVQYMTPPAARGRCRGGSIACSDCGDHIYQCANFGACFQKCTNIAYLGTKPLDYIESVVNIALAVWALVFPSTLAEMSRKQSIIINQSK